MNPMPYKDPAMRIAASLRWNKANPDRMRAASQRFYYRLRAKILRLLGGKCAKCSTVGKRGRTDGLILHHKFMDGDAHRRQIKTKDMLNWIAHHNFDVSRFELLCRGCHNIVHGVVPPVRKLRH